MKHIGVLVNLYSILDCKMSMFLFLCQQIRVRRSVMAACVWVKICSRLYNHLDYLQCIGAFWKVPQYLCVKPVVLYSPISLLELERINDRFRRTRRIGSGRANNCCFSLTSITSDLTFISQYHNHNGFQNSDLRSWCH
jgi:hypothetical protein